MEVVVSEVVEGGLAVQHVGRTTSGDAHIAGDVDWTVTRSPIVQKTSRGYSYEGRGNQG